MEKTIIVLSGNNEGKTTFIDVVKANDYWVWNFNFRNLLSMLSHKLGWDGERDNNYCQFVSDLTTLANNHFNSEEWYIRSMIEKFFESEKVDVAIVHNCDNTLSQALQDQYNCYSVHIVDNEEDVINNTEYCKVLNCNGSDYEQNIVLALATMTKDFSEKGE